MVKGCSNSFIQVVLFVFNFAFVILGALIFGVGTYLLTKSSSLKEIIEGPDVAAVMVILTGSSIFLVSFFGCYGAIKEHACLLKTYGIIVGAVALLQIAGASLLLVYSGKLDVYVEKPIQKTFNDYKRHRSAVDYFQYTLACCGVNGKEFWSEKYADEFKTGTYPTGCCRDPTVSSDYCNADTDTIFKDGCLRATNDLLKNSTNVGVVAVIIAAIIQMLASCFACMLANAV